VSAASDDLDIIADNAPGGGIRAEGRGSGHRGSTGIRPNSQRCGHVGGDYDLFDVSVARMSNAVIAWKFDPNDEERAAVEYCLS